MRALTLTQPWAGLVASGIKLVENRPRPIMKRDAIGTRFAIHASREIDESVYYFMRKRAPDLFEPTTIQNVRSMREDVYRLTRITSAVIAVATLRDQAEVNETTALATLLDAGMSADQARWAFGPMIYMLEDVRALATPVPARGYQGFWTLPADVAAKVEAQLA